MENLVGLFPYWVVIVLMMTGFYIAIARGNLLKKVIGLNIFQASVVLFYLVMAKVRGGTAPILKEGLEPYTKEGLPAYTHPLPGVLMLTAIVVGVATTAVALALVVRVKEAYGTVEEDEILAADRAAEEESHGGQAAEVGNPPRRADSGSAAGHGDLGDRGSAGDRRHPGGRRRP